MLNRSIEEIKSCGEAKNYCIPNKGCCACHINSGCITVDMVQVAISCNTFNKIYILKDAEYIKQWRTPMTYKLVKNPVNIFHDPDKYPTLTKANTKKITGRATESKSSNAKADIIKQAQALLASLKL